MPQRSLDRLKTMLDHGEGSDRWNTQFNEDFTTRMGFYRVQVVNKRWWLIDPHNQPCLSMGVNHITFGPYPGDEDPNGYYPYEQAAYRKYGSAEVWAKAQAKRLRQWNFNTVGSWSSPILFDQGLVYTVNMAISFAAAGDVWLHGDFPDVFSPVFEQAAIEMAKETCTPRKDDPNLLGYFTDNELDWEGWRRRTSLFDYFMQRKAATPARQALVAQLKERYGGDIQAFNQNWAVTLNSFDDLFACTELQPGPDASAEQVKKDKDEFLRLAARTYFSVCQKAIRSFDQNHMIIGVRFGGTAHPIVVEECVPYVDIVSYNNYSYDAPKKALEEVFNRTWKPIMITEWAFKAMDSGLPNTKGAAIPVYTQEDRANGYERYVTQALSLPYIVGLHWFMWCDQPPLGRSLDGENSNYGLVDNDDEPYCTLVERMRVVNRDAIQIAKHAPPLLEND